MPNNLTDVDEWTDPVQSIADGDELDSANLTLGIQDLANRTLFTASRLPGVAPGGVWVAVNPLAGAPSSGGTGTWVSGGNWVNTAHGTKTVGFGFSCPHGGKVQTLRAWITPAGSHAGLPATMPQLAAQFFNLSSGGSTSPAVQSDASPSLVAYESLHNITLTLGSPVLLLPGISKTGIVSFSGEDSTNANDNLVLHGIEYFVEPV